MWIYAMSEIQESFSVNINIVWKHNYLSNFINENVS